MENANIICLSVIGLSIIYLICHIFIIGIKLRKMTTELKEEIKIGLERGLYTEADIIKLENKYNCKLR